MRGRKERITETEEWTPELANPEEMWEYTPPDVLLDAAFRYKKTKLWEKLWSSDVFALRFLDGEIGYISVMGRDHSHCAIGIYMNDEGFDSYRHLAFDPPAETGYEERERILQQRCLQIILDSMDFLNSREIEAVRAYAERNGIRLAGKNAYPHFWKFTPNHTPWHPDPPEEERWMIEAADACAFLAKCFRKDSPASLGFTSLTPKTQKVPLVIHDEDGYWLEGFAQLPKKQLVEFPSPAALDEITLGHIKKLRKKGSVSAKLVRMIEAVADPQGGAPYYPAALMAANDETELAYMPELQADFEEFPEKAVDHFLQNLLKDGMHPAVINVNDRRTGELLRTAAEKLGATIRINDRLPVLEEILDALMEEDGPFDDPEEMYSDMMEMLEMLESLPDEALDSMPPFLKEDLENLLDAGVVPAETARRLRDKLR